MNKQYNINHFLVADWHVCIKLDAAVCDDVLKILPSFTPFACGSDDCGDGQLFSMTIEKELAADENVKFVRVCDTGNGNIVVEQKADGGYQFLIENINGEECARLITNADFTECRCAGWGRAGNVRFGINNAMMLAYSNAGALRQTLLVHASVVSYGDYGYAFVAKSGTGKSTQTSNWLKTLAGTELMNDDNPVVRMRNGVAMVYGSPWSGKTPCYRQVSAVLGAVTLIDRAKENSVERQNPLVAFSTLLSSCSVMKWDKVGYKNVCDTVAAILGVTPGYVLHCTAEPESAIVCQKGIVR